MAVGECESPQRDQSEPVESSASATAVSSSSVWMGLLGLIEESFAVHDVGKKRPYSAFSALLVVSMHHGAQVQLLLRTRAQTSIDRRSRPPPQGWRWDSI
jgi:hypothetical protein